MADVKISQLPVATTPVDGTEVLPIVQSATTKQVSIANLTAGRAMAASSLTLTTPLAVTSGGTGIATAAQGSLLSATGADTFSATRTPTLGLAGTAAGTLGLSGSTSGVVTLATAATAGTWTFTLPTTGGTNGYILTTNGSGVSSWTNPTALGIDLDIGTTAITGGTTGRVLYNNAGLLGEYAVTGTGSVVLGTTPTFTTSALFPAGTVSAPGISVSGDTNTGIYFPAADTIGFVEGGVEAMRITSAGDVGIGTTSPGAKLTVASGNIRLSDGQQIEWGGSTNSIEGSNASNYLRFWTNNTARMTLDASGNLGVGGTPAANQRLLVSGGRSGFYANSEPFSLYVQYNSSTNGMYIGSPSANALSFSESGGTERMRIDASGNVGIGTSSPATRLHIASGSANDEVGFIQYENTSTSTGGATNAQLIGKSKFGTVQLMVWENNGARIGIRSTANGGAGNLLFTAGGDVERARIDSNGNVIINTAAIATNATNGFLYVPTCAGTPTGTPTTYTGRAPIVVDTTNNKLYFYSSGVWRDAGP